MTRKIASLSIITAIISFCLCGFSPDVKDPKARIVEASHVLFNPPASQEILVDSLIELLEVALVLTSQSPYQEEIEHHIDVAKDLIKNTSLFNDKARQYLSFAYRMVTGGQKFLIPEELDEFVTPKEAQQKSPQYVKNLITKSLSALDAGQNESAAKLLLEVVLMVITPVSG